MWCLTKEISTQIIHLLWLQGLPAKCSNSQMNSGLSLAWRTKHISLWFWWMWTKKSSSPVPNSQFAAFFGCSAEYKDDFWDLSLQHRQHHEFALQDVRMIFEMFDSNDDSTMDIKEFETITSNLRRQGKNAGVTRTGFKEQPEWAFYLFAWASAVFLFL